jgi:hypothetical protein
MDEKLKAELAIHRENRKKAKVSESAYLHRAGIRKGKKNTRYTDKQKLTALQAYSSTGSWIIAAKESGIDYNYLKQLKFTQWWQDSLKEVQQEQDDILDSQLSELITDGVNVVKDRLKNGDWMWNSKENKFTRKPLKATDALKVASTLMDKRNVMRGKPTKITEQINVSDRLQALAMEFEKFQKARTIEVQTEEIIDAEQETELQGRIQGISGPTEAD